MIDEKDILINDISKQYKEFLETLDLKILSINEPISEENKNECYIIEEYKRSYTPDGVDIIKSTHLVKITDFKWKNQNSIHLVLQKSLPEDTIFTGIEIKYPKSMLFGNIKCWGNVNGVYSYPASVVENASLVPLLSMPIETNPNLRVFQYWFTESFLPWNIAKNYIQGKDILDLLNIGNHALNPQKQVFNNARIASGKIGWLDRQYPIHIPPEKPNKNDFNVLNIFDNFLQRKYFYTEGEGLEIKTFDGWLSTAPNGKYGDVILEFASAKLIGNLEEILRFYLTYSYNYDRKFQGAQYDEKGNPINKVAELRQKFEGQKPEDVIDGLFEEWKFKNSTYLTEDAVKRFKQVVYMLSNYTYSKYAINKGYNDDIKLIVPYYFELISTPNEKEKGYWIFEDCIVKLKSSYFDFSNSKITVKNKDISENHIYQLEANYFNWLSITNELETNNIPSLIPSEIKLSDGEYGKYLTNLIISNDKIEDYLNYFSQWYRLLYSKAVWISTTKNLVEDNIKITYDVKLFALNEIAISGIWGYGNYDITIFTEKEQININNLQLFNKNNEKLSLVTLEI